MQNNVEEPLTVCDSCVMYLNSWVLGSLLVITGYLPVRAAPILHLLF